MVAAEEVNPVVEETSEEESPQFDLRSPLPIDCEPEYFNTSEIDTSGHLSEDESPELDLLKVMATPRRRSSSARKRKDRGDNAYLGRATKRIRADSDDDSVITDAEQETPPETRSRVPNGYADVLATVRAKRGRTLRLVL